MKAITIAISLGLLLGLACSDAPLIVRAANRVVLVEVFSSTG